MSRKYLQYLAAQKRDMEVCTRPGCGHPRGWHVGDKNCIKREVNQCTCPKFLSKEVQ